MLKLQHGSLPDQIAVYFGIATEMLMEASPGTMAMIVGCTLTFLAVCIFQMSFNSNNSNNSNNNKSSGNDKDAKKTN